MKKQSLSLESQPKLKHRFNHRTAFTIVELLVVIVVIGILAAITIVAYSVVSQRAIVVSLQSNLDDNADKLKVYKILYSSYPATLDANQCPLTPTADAKYCLKASPNETMVYTPTPQGSTSPQAFRLTNTNGNNSYAITNSTTPAIVTTAYGSSVGRACPSGFIPVPGSGTYGTNDFCVMKYEAKADNGSGIGDTSQNTGYNTWPANTYPISTTRQLVSTAEGYPVAIISQTNALTAASSYTKNCSSGCHLITEAEWMTIAQNVLSVPSNWSTGTVGSGYIYSGHNDNVPATALTASTNDSDGYYGTGNTATTGPNQRRTLTLTNGEVIWDLAGNVWEWTAGTTTGGQPGVTGEAAFGWKEWTDVNPPGSLAVNPFPSSTGLNGSSSWNSLNGVGKLYSYVSDTSLRAFFRSGNWSHGVYAGILTLYIYNSPVGSSNYLGLRVAQ